MSQRESTPTVSELVGRNMRRIREEHGVVLADISRAAKDAGLTWDPSAVSRIETGKRDLTLEEFLALPLVMTLAINQNVTLTQLLDGLKIATYVDSFGRGILGYFVLAMLAEPMAATSPSSPQTIGVVVNKLLNEGKRVIQARRADTDERSAARELQSIADDLGVHVADVSRAAEALWGRHTISPTQERERRLLELKADLSQPTHVRTLRGHITRQLMSELREYFDKRGSREEDDDGASA
jgi:transcriptional regulator with XRE-family HTH domain